MMIEQHHYLTDVEFEKQFQACKLDPTLFSHEAHLRLAWINIKQYGLEKAEIRIQEQLRKFVVTLGAEAKYNATVTVAAIRIVGHFMRKSKVDNFKDFIQEFPQLKSNFKALIKNHYSFDVYHSTLAKATFVAPDIKPFR